MYNWLPTYYITDKSKAVFLNLSVAMDLLLNHVGAAAPLPKFISYIFFKHNRLTKTESHKYYHKLGKDHSCGHD
jgi:hypothetical protein